MPTPTYTAIASITLGSSASSVTFSSIPQDYRDLVLVVSGSVAVNTRIEVTFNNDSSNIYHQVWMRGIENFGTNTGTITQTKMNLLLSDIDANSQFQSVSHIMDYSVTDKHTNVLLRGQHFTIDPRFVAEAKLVRYANTSAITQIKLSVPIGSISSGSTFSLYGIEA